MAIFLAQMFLNLFAAPLHSQWRHLDLNDRVQCRVLEAGFDFFHGLCCILGEEKVWMVGSSTVMVSVRGRYYGRLLVMHAVIERVGHGTERETKLLLL